jgi:hypothetical protein
MPSKGPIRRQLLVGLAIDAARFKAPFDLDQAGVRVYDPWKDRWSAVTLTGSSVALPDFQRSLVLRIEGSTGSGRQ